MPKIKKRIDRQGAYTEFNAHARLSLLAVTNAVAAAHHAELLHTSRQRKHLQLASKAILHAQELLVAAQCSLDKMSLKEK